jgi:DNA-binding MarR family transcriptional regulator
MAIDPQYLQRVGLLFRSVNANFRVAIEGALHERGIRLSFAQVSVLSILDSTPGLNGAQIARLAMVSPQALTGVLRQLVDGGHLERRPHPESLRADSWHLTSKGAKLLARSREAFGAVTSRMLSALEKQDVANLERYLRHCAASLEGDAGDLPRGK